MLLHGGTDDISGQEVSKALERFHFVSPPSGGGIIHCNQSGSALQLQVDIFCRDICEGVNQWMAAAATAREIRITQATQLLTIHDLSRGFSF